MTFKELQLIMEQLSKGGVDSWSITVLTSFFTGLVIASQFAKCVSLDGDAIIGDAALQGRGAASLEDGVAVIEVPLTGTGTANIGVEVSFGFCDIAKGEVCRLGSGRWKFELTVSDDGESAEVKLKFPKHK